MYRYFQNFFMTATTGSFKKMLLMGKDHRDKLSKDAGDPYIQPLYNDLNAAFTRFEHIYMKLPNYAGIYRGHTYTIETMIQELSSIKIKQWDIQVQSVYMDTSREYLELFQQGRKPFQNGAYDVRIGAVGTLNMGLSRFPNLANTQVDVENFLSAINTARNSQQQVERDVQELHQQLEESRKKLAAQMHRVFGHLLEKHYEDTSKLANYYEIKYLQKPASSPSLVLSKYNIAATSRINLFDGILTGNSYITIKNTGTTVLKIFTSNDANSVTPVDVIELPVLGTLTEYASNLTDGLGYNWLIVINDAAAEGKLEAAKEEIKQEEQED